MSTRHLNRQELLAALRGKSGYDRSHLDHCQECQNDLSLLATYGVAGKAPLPDPPDHWVTRAIALALPQPSLADKLRRVMATLTFDSWTLPAPIGVRGHTSSTQRRIRLEVQPVSLEIRAERKAHHWTFVAQAMGPLISDCTLEVAGTRLTSDASGFFQWSSKTPPRSLILQAGEMVIDVPELSWKMPKD